MKNKIIIGSRGSELALWQAKFVRKSLSALFPEKLFEIKIIKTTGDKILDTALSKIGDKGLFTRQIENELLDGKIDFAVHSLKDLQTVQPAGLKIGAVTKREIPNDVLISKQFASIDELPENALVATGSLRRRCQLLARRKDLQIMEIRGNVPSRIGKFFDSDAAGLILAFAGVHRLGLDAHISQIIPLDQMIPAVGQGALAIEIRAEDAEMQTVIKKMNDEETSVCVSAERSFLRTLEGGCQVPIAGFARLDGGKITLEGLVGSLDGQTIIRDSLAGNRAEDLGVKLAETLIERGANELLEKNRNLKN